MSRGPEEASQEEAAALLARPGTFAAADAEVTEIETHISRIFIAGDRALKMKRAVRFPYLDFTTLQGREAACRAEVELNRRTAPVVYRGVLAVTRQADGTLALDGAGEAVEWLVDMNRFDEAGLFDRMAQAGTLRRHPMVDLADHIAVFHGEAAVTPGAGGARGTAMIVENIIECFGEAKSVLAPEKVAAWSEISRAALARLTEILDARRDAGAVRHCHGDLHLRNICMIDGKPMLFDGIEFNTAFSEIDTLYDLAFLLMDLDYRGLRRLADVTFNRYLDVTGEVLERPGTLSVLPLFLSMRAAIRAHVDAAQVVLLSDPDQQAERRLEAGRYMDMALEYLEPPAPRLVAVGGLSGGGKSRMARELAPFVGAAPGARVVRTDAVRKRLAGAAQESQLGPEGYTHEMHERTYAAFVEEARAALAQGHAVVADAVFPGPDQRAAIEAVAREMGVPFHGLWIEAPEDVRVARITKRRRNISDVTEEIAREQSTYELGDITWTRIDSSGPREVTVKKGKASIGIG